MRGQGHRPDRQTGRVSNRWTRDSAGWHVPSRADFIGHCPGNLHCLQAAEATLPSDRQFGSVGRAFGYQFSSLVWGLGFAPEQRSLFSSEANKMRQSDVMFRRFRAKLRVYGNHRHGCSFKATINFLILNDVELVGLQNCCLGFWKFWKFLKIFKIFDNFFCFSKFSPSKSKFSKNRTIY